MEVSQLHAPAVQLPVPIEKAGLRDGVEALKRRKILLETGIKRYSVLQTSRCQSKVPPPLVKQEPQIVCKIHSYIDLYFESLMKTGETWDH
jgi:hypothetical protein